MTIQPFTHCSSAMTPEATVEVSGGSSNMITHNGLVLKLQYFAITIASQFSGENCLISVTSSGTMTLNTMSISFTGVSGYSTTSKALISANGGAVSMSGTNTFRLIKRESGNGGVFEFSSFFHQRMEERFQPPSHPLTNSLSLPPLLIPAHPQRMAEQYTSMQVVHSPPPLSPSQISRSHRVVRVHLERMYISTPLHWL